MPAMSPLTRRVLEYIEECGPVSTVDIREHLQLTGPLQRVNSMLETLERHDLAKRCGTIVRGARKGQPCVLWDTPMHQRLVIPERPAHCLNCGRGGWIVHVSGQTICGWCRK